MRSCTFISCKYTLIVRRCMESSNNHLRGINRLSMESNLITSIRLKRMLYNHGHLGISGLIMSTFVYGAEAVNVLSLSLCIMLVLFVRLHKTLGWFSDFNCWDQLYSIHSICLSQIYWLAHFQRTSAPVSLLTSILYDLADGEQVG